MSVVSAMSSPVLTRYTGSRDAMDEYIPSRAASGMER